MLGWKENAWIRSFNTPNSYLVIYFFFKYATTWQLNCMQARAYLLILRQRHTKDMLKKIYNVHAYLLFTNCLLFLLIMSNLDCIDVVSCLFMYTNQTWTWVLQMIWWQATFLVQLQLPSNVQLQVWISYIPL